MSTRTYASDANLRPRHVQSEKELCQELAAISARELGGVVGHVASGAVLLLFVMGFVRLAALAAGF